MRTTLPLVAVLIAMTACTTPPRTPKPLIPPPRGPAYVPAADSQQTDEEATRRFLEREIERRSPPRETAAPPEAPRQQTDEEATRRYLDQEIERRGELQASVKPPAPQPPQVVERRVYMRWPRPYARAWAYDSPAYGGSYDYYDYWYAPQPYHRYGGRGSVVEQLPWYTAYGAGVGALFGNAAGHTGRGAAIGAGVGLLLDMNRWRW